MIIKLLNISLRWLFGFHNYLFFKHIHSTARVQEKILLKNVRRNKYSRFGKDHTFSAIKSIADYQQSVPLMTYDDYSPYICQIADGEKNILFRENIYLFEPSSGSTAASKYIPYTRTLQKEFQRGIQPWLYNLYSTTPGLNSGTAYWSISPALHQWQKTAGGIPVGFDEDTGYFGSLIRYFLNKIFFVPALIRTIDNTNSFYYCLLLCMLREKKLSMISVWNPTYLLLLLQNFHQWKQQLIKDIEEGTITPPEPIPPSVEKILKNKNKKRAQEIRRIVIDHDSTELLFERLWPQLKLISCWASANAAAHIARLRILFPTVEIQGKGLISTEAFVSFPLVGITGSALAYRSHFFEFIECDPHTHARTVPPSIKTAWQLIKNGVYSVVVTTGGGFYRYQLFDLIQVVGFLDECPLIEFIGRENLVSDFFGEKLHEAFVRKIVQSILEKLSVNADYYLLAPETDEHQNYYYTLFIELQKSDNVNFLQGELENALCENYHYAYCRTLNQLGACKIFIIDPGTGINSYIRRHTAEGMTLGNIKPAALSPRTGWSYIFSGTYRG